ncbi:hypothetical protein [Lacinutrix sp. MedPE-SW]|uniref:hypothetical protein n=1 Tax=Lacinutrix sp. MedPE-SW TaxID=1860087 RepID=UPI00090F3380|nr:hypothetical protein [Lacinutrix sp. MedPE-SW]OIQ16650.1 MAG: hypothetical protein BM549_13230 [Lacinutrix sp. MedPE-SW]
MKINKFILLFLALISFYNTNAQCAMCRAVLESEEGLGTAKSINDGIIYLAAIPYILVFGIGYYIYRRYFRVK